MQNTYEIDSQQKAELLINSLKYIKRFHKKIVVIKYGGHAMVDEAIRQSVIQDIVLLKYVGMYPVIVHGGGPAINEMLGLKGIEPEFVDGLRVTSPEIMSVVEMVLSGSIGPDLAAGFNANDTQAVAVSGKDAKMMRAKLKNPDLGLVGEVTRVDTDYIHSLLEADYIPIISPIAYGPDGQSLNINSDEAACVISQALKAYKLILITDVDGVMADPDQADSLISQMDIEDVTQAVRDGIITGGMIPKLNCCVRAVAGGVHKCHIINGTVPHSIIFELFTQTGIGTMVVKDRLQHLQGKEATDEAY